MGYHHKTTAQEIQKKLQYRIDTDTAELKALKQVNINTGHKNLNNKSVTGAKVADYIGIDKAVNVYYQVKHQDGHPEYKHRTITAYTYNDINGVEIGAVNGLRTSRTLTPKEFIVVLNDVIESVASNLGQFKSEYRRADTIAKQQNALVDKINAFNNKLTHASEAQI